MKLKLLFLFFCLNITLYAQDTISPPVKEESTIAEVLPLTEENVKAEILRLNIPHPEIVLAQAKLESGNFTSKLTHTHNNIFGLKIGNSYRKYPNWMLCVADYKKRISNRYKGGCYYQFLTRIRYAGSSNYIKALKSMN